MIIYATFVPIWQTIFPLNLTHTLPLLLLPIQWIWLSLPFHVPNLTPLSCCLGSSENPFKSKENCLSGCGVLAPVHFPSRGPATVDSPQLFVQYSSSFLPHLILIYCIRNMRTRHAVMSRAHLEREVEATLSNNLYICFIVLSGVRLSPLGTSAIAALLYQPQMIDDGDCGAIGGLKIGRGNRSTRRKAAPVPLFPPQIPYDLTRARTWTAAVGSYRLTTWAMERL
jgi:hypothetical protein